MQVIRKKISLECARSRQQGLLPFYDYNGDSDLHFATTASTDGNYGNFVTNLKQYSGIDFVTFKKIVNSETALTPTLEVNYMDIMYRYNKIYNMLYKGLWMKFSYSGKNVYTSLYDDDSDEEHGNTNIYQYAIEDKSVLKKTKSDVVYELKNISRNLPAYVIFVDDVNEILECSKFFNASINVFSTDNRNKILGGGIGIEDNVTSVHEFLNFVDTKLIGKLNVPRNIHGARVPEFFYYCDILEWLNWFIDNEPMKDDDCCVKQEWEDRGGDNMYKFLKQNNNLYESGVLTTKGLYADAPFLEVPVLLQQKFENIGVMTADFGGEITGNQNNLKEITGVTVEQIYSESRLSDVRFGRKYYDDNGELLDMLLYSDSGCTTLYETKYDSNRIIEPPKYFKYPYKEGEIINLSYNKYYDEYGNALKKLTVTTETEMRGNVITRINKDIENGTVTFEYIIGAIITLFEDRNFENSYNGSQNVFSLADNASAYHYKNINIIPNTGIKYKETYKLIEGTKTILFNGEEITVTGTTIDYDSNKKTVYSEELGLYRETNIAEIIGYKKGDAFIDNDIDNQGCVFIYIENGETYDGKVKPISKSYNTPIYKEDSLNGITASIIEKVDISIDRGRASAFETHYKLSECSTFEDLENYGNNFFNI